MGSGQWAVGRGQKQQLIPKIRSHVRLSMCGIYNYSNGEGWKSCPQQ